MSLSYRGYSSRPSLGTSSSTSSSYRSGDSYSSSSGYGRTSSLYGRDSLSGLRSSTGSSSSYRRTNSFESSSGLGSGSSSSSSSSYMPRSSYSSGSSSSSRPGHHSYSSSSTLHSTSTVGSRVANDVIDTRAERQRRRLSESSTLSSSSALKNESDNDRNNNNDFGSRRSSLRRRNESKAKEDEKQEDKSAATNTARPHRRREYEERIKDEDKPVTRRNSRLADADKIADPPVHTDITEGRRFSERIVSNISVVQETSHSTLPLKENDNTAAASSATASSNDDLFNEKLASYVHDAESRISSKAGLQESGNCHDRVDSQNRTTDNHAQNFSKSGSLDTYDEDISASKSRFGIFVTDRFNKLGISSLHSAAQQGSVSTQRLSETGRRLSAPAYSPCPLQGGRDSQTLDDRDADSGRQHLNQVSKSRIANGTTKAPGRTSSIATTGTTATKNKAAQEIERLESLCEARTKELTQTKIQLKASHQAFDAMSVLLNYCCTELNAFECPQLATNLAMVQKQLTDCLAEITELTGQKETLTKDVEQMTKEKEDAIRKVEETTTAAESEKEEHSRLTKELDTTHNAALTAQRDELTTKHNAEVKKLKERHDYQMQELMQNHERSVSDTRNETKMEMNGVRLAHLEEIQSLRNKHDSQMEELHKQHRNKLEDITLRFETIKLTLSEKVESLKGECEDHLRRARCSEEALQKDADVKVQMAIAPYLALPKEIDSLKTVVEMRNEEIQKLKTRNTDLESQLEELPIAKEKIISLQQKVENLEAVINIKTDHEKQLHERCQVLMRKCDRETRANKRLSMDYEQVVWRMSQSEYGGSSESLTKRQLSRSPPRSETTSPDPRRRGGGNGNHHTSSPNNGEVRLREKKKRCESESDRNLRSRSATFVIDRHNDNSGGVDAFGGIASSPPSSPRNLSASSANTTPLRWKTRPGRDAGGLEEMRNEDFNKRMCQSAGAELISSALNGGGKNSGNVSDYNQKTGYQLSSSSQFTTDSAEMMIDDDMMMMSGGSYARSLSGVSDSGICDVPSALNSGNFDSMTGSEMLNSSVFSTDSDWVGGDGGKSSANASMSFDSSVQNSTDFSSGSNSGEGQGHDGDFVKNSNTVVDMSSIQSTTVQGEANTPVERDSNFSSSMSESVSYFQSSCSSMDDTVLEKTLDLGVSGSGSDGSGKAIDNYEFQIKLPDTAEEEEDVFETSMKQQ